MGLFGTVGKIMAVQALKSVATLLTTPDDLHILTITLNVSATEPEAAFQLEVNPQLRAAPPKTVENWSFPVSTFRIPNQLAPGQQELEPSSALPRDFIDALRERLPAEADVPLWIRFGMPAGYLRLLPWDRLLHAGLNRPVLRLIDLESPPPRELDTKLDVVLCASEPRAKSNFEVPDLLPEIARSILGSHAREKVVLHVFVDGDKYDSVSAGLAPELGQQVHVYRAPEALPSGTVQPGAGDEAPSPLITNVWLQWICQQLGRPVDVVHFVCHGYLASDQGWIAVAESPTRNVDEAWARFIGSAELDRFLVRSGAWSVVFSSPPGNFSRTGLRLLVNQISEDGLRSALLHDLADDRDCTQLAKAYKFLYCPGPDFAPTSAALSIYCHPSLVKVGTPANRLVRGVSKALPGHFGFAIPDDITEDVAHELDELLRQFQDRGGVPPWLATTQRYVEQRKLELRRLEREAGDEQRLEIKKARTMLAMIELTAVRLAKVNGDSA